ncbi:MAG: urate hydroxylase PuuD [Terriglobales bacterium]
MSPENTALVQMALRWVHLVAGIVWIGFLYFFNLVNVPFMKELDPAMKGKVFPALMKRALFWFRYSAFVTVFAGIWYWMTIVGADLRNARALSPGEHISGGITIGGFFLVWTIAWFLCSLVTKGKLRLAVVLLAYALIVSAASYAYLQMNSHGWESNRLLCIGIGGGMGWIMIFNVWGIIWRHSKRLIAWTEKSAAEGSPMPPAAALLAQEVFLVSRANFALSFPMLFLMGAASHYPVFG